MGFIRQDYKILRTINLSGFSQDPDWVGDFDGVAARAAGVQTFVPRMSGQLEVVFGFSDGVGTLIDPNGARVDLTMVLLGPGDPSGPALNAIVEWETCDNQEAIKVCYPTRKLGGPSVLGCRVKQLVSVPGAAEFMAILARVG